MAKNEAVLLPVNCVITHRPFYARYDYSYDGVWVLTYGLKELSEDAGSGSGNISKIDLSNSRVGPQYKCPHCGNTSFVKCGNCGKLTCYSGNGNFTCDHCGNSGTVEGTIDNLEGRSKHSQ